MDSPLRCSGSVLGRKIKKLRSIDELMDVTERIELKPDTETDTDEDTYSDKDTDSEKVKVVLSKSKKGKKVKRESVKKELDEEAKCEQFRGEFLVGYRVNIWWPKDRVFYPGEITSFVQESNEHEVLYDDGHVEILNLDKEKFELIEDAKNVILGLEAPVLDVVKRESNKGVAEEGKPKKEAFFWSGYTG